MQSVEVIIEEIKKVARDKEKLENLIEELNNGLGMKDYIKKTFEFLDKIKKDSIFEFFINEFVLVDNKNSNEYFESIKQCPNCKRKILIQGTKKHHAANIVENNFVIGRDNWYGIGTYFSEQLDYVTYYTNNKSFGKIPKVGETFPIAGAEVYYDSSKFKQIYYYSYQYIFSNLPTSADIQEHVEKVIEKNGIHYIEVEGKNTYAINDKGKVLVKGINETKNLSKDVYIGREYAVTERSQILPIFSFSMERVEYCIIWRDNNFISGTFKNELNERKKIKNELGFNLYIETSTESALNLIWKKKYNKVILITNVGKDLEGKKRYLSLMPLFYSLQILIDIWNGLKIIQMHFIQNIPYFLKNL